MKIAAAAPPRDPQRKRLRRSAAQHRRSGISSGGTSQNTLSTGLVTSFRSGWISGRPGPRTRANSAVGGALSFPQAGEVRLSIESRRWSGRVYLSVRHTPGLRRTVVEPLRRGEPQCHREHHRHQRADSHRIPYRCRHAPPDGPSSRNAQHFTADLAHRAGSLRGALKDANGIGAELDQILTELRPWSALLRLTDIIGPMPT
jgi:hypothetical protein